MKVTQNWPDKLLWIFDGLHKKTEENAKVVSTRNKQIFVGEGQGLLPP